MTLIRSTSPARRRKPSFSAVFYFAYAGLAVLALVLAPAAYAAAWRENADVVKLFKEAGVEGTFVLYDAGEDLLLGHGQYRANERFIPASTFKLPNTLIGLATGAVKSVDEVLPYGGEPQPFDIWEKDMSLRDAITISNVPIYRELARRVGLKRMRKSVRKLEYGNGDVGDAVDSFWLKGPLKISAVEQTRFLDKLARGKLPFPAKAQSAVRDIARIETGDGWELFAKTGLGGGGDAGPEVGWWVGWVEKGGRVYTFALNIAIRGPDDKDKRVPLGKAALKALVIL
jgi:beta-lactamase class D